MKKNKNKKIKSDADIRPEADLLDHVGLSYLGINNKAGKGHWYKIKMIDVFKIQTQETCFPVSYQILQNTT